MGCGSAKALRDGGSGRHVSADGSTPASRIEVHTQGPSHSRNLDSGLAVHHPALQGKLQSGPGPPEVDRAHPSHCTALPRSQSQVQTCSRSHVDEACSSSLQYANDSFRTRTSVNGTSRIRVTLSLDGSTLRVEKESFGLPETPGGTSLGTSVDSARSRHTDVTSIAELRGGNGRDTRRPRVLSARSDTHIHYTCLESTPQPSPRVKKGILSKNSNSNNSQLGRNNGSTGNGTRITKRTDGGGGGGGPGRQKSSGTSCHNCITATPSSSPATLTPPSDNGISRGSMPEVQSGADEMEEERVTLLDWRRGTVRNGCLINEACIRTLPTGGSFTAPLDVSPEPLFPPLSKTSSYKDSSATSSVSDVSEQTSIKANPGTPVESLFSSASLAKRAATHSLTNSTEDVDITSFEMATHPNNSSSPSSSHFLPVIKANRHKSKPLATESGKAVFAQQKHRYSNPGSSSAQKYKAREESGRDFALPPITSDTTKDSPSSVAAVTKPSSPVAPLRVQDQGRKKAFCLRKARSENDADGRGSGKSNGFSKKGLSRLFHRAGKPAKQSVSLDCAIPESPDLDDSVPPAGDCLPIRAFEDRGDDSSGERCHTPGSAASNDSLIRNYTDTSLDSCHNSRSPVNGSVSSPKSANSNGTVPTQLRARMPRATSERSIATTSMMNKLGLRKVTSSGAISSSPYRLQKSRSTMSSSSSISGSLRRRLTGKNRAKDQILELGLMMVDPVGHSLDYQSSTTDEGLDLAEENSGSSSGANGGTSKEKRTDLLGDLDIELEDLEVHRNFFNGGYKNNFFLSLHSSFHFWIITSNVFLSNYGYSLGAVHDDIAL